MHFCPQNRQKATPAPSIAHLPAMPLHCPSKLPLQALLNPPHGPCTAPSCPCTHSHALLLPPHAALQASQILYSRCTPKAAYNGWGGGSVPSLPPIGTAAPLRPAEPSAQRDAPGTVPPSPTTALPVFFHCLHILSLLFFANPKSGPIPPGDCILPHTLLPSPPPRKKKQPLGIYSPTSKPLRLRGGSAGWGCRGWEGAALPTAACLPAPAASSSAALLRSHSGTGAAAAAVPGPPSVGTAGAGAAAPPLLCKICPLTSFLPREPSPIAPPPPPLPHICAQVGVYRISFCPPLNSCPPQDVLCCPLPGYRWPPGTPSGPIPWGNWVSQSLRGVFHPLFPYLLQ